MTVRGIQIKRVGSDRWWMKGYRIEKLEPDLFRICKVNGNQGSDKDSSEYLVYIDPDKLLVKECQCLGFRYRQYCKYVDWVQAILESERKKEEKEVLEEVPF